MLDAKVINPDEEDLINLKEADPFEVMKLVAEGLGIKLRDPKPNCKKCHGRGFLGRNAGTGEPVPCTCIFENPVSNIRMVPQNRQERRHGK